MSGHPAYYRDPHEPRVERYWDGSGWTGQVRPADEHSLALPSGVPLPPALPGSADPRHPLRTVGYALMILAAVVALAAVMTGAALIGHGVCSGGGSTSQCIDTVRHPDVGVGLGVLFGGLLQAAMLGGLGLLCREVDTLRYLAPSSGPVAATS